MKHKDYIYQLLLFGNIETALDELLQGTKANRQSQLYRELSMQSGRFHDNNNKFSKGIQTNEEHKKTNNQISSSLFNLLRKYKPNLSFELNFQKKKGEINVFQEILDKYKNNTKVENSNNKYNLDELVEGAKMRLEKAKELEKMITNMNNEKKMQFNNKKLALIECLENSFDTENLDYFCFKYFQDVKNNSPRGETKQMKIIRLIRYCEQHKQISNLLKYLKKERPDMYQQYFTNL